MNKKIDKLTLSSLLFFFFLNETHYSLTQHLILYRPQPQLCLRMPKLRSQNALRKGQDVTTNERSQM